MYHLSSLHLGQRVITLGQMDEVHGRPEGAARKAFNRNKDKLIEGRHFFRGSSVSRTTSGRGDDVLLTERGYLVLVKTFRDDLAWVFSIPRSLRVGGKGRVVRPFAP